MPLGPLLRQPWYRYSSKFFCMTKALPHFTNLSCMQPLRLLRRACASLVQTNHTQSPTGYFLPLIQSIATTDQFLQLHASLIVTGAITDEFLAGKLLSSPFLPDLQHARKIFMQMGCPNLFSWNTMINIFSVKPHRSFLLYKEMLGAVISPDSYTFLFLFKTCANESKLSEGEQIHCNVVKTGFGSSEFVVGGMIAFYVGCGIVESAGHLFCEIPHRGVVLWTLMIRGYISANQPINAVNLFLDMGVAGVVPDAVTIATVLPACSESLVRKLHGYIHKRGFEMDSFVAIGLLNAYAECGVLGSSYQVFAEIPHKDVVAWNAMIHQFLKCGAIEMACDLFAKTVKKDVISWNTMIAGLARAGQCKEALALFNQMESSGIVPNKVTMLSALSSCAGLGALAIGVWLHVFIEKNNMNSDGFLDCALIDMYSKCGSIDQALQVFKKNPKHDRFPWTSIICGLAMHGLGEHALHLFSCMQQLGIQPDEITFLGLLSACAHAGLTDDGCQIFNSMGKTYNIRPKVEHYGCMVDIFGRAGRLREAYRLILGMPFEPNAVIWSSLLSACRVHNNVELCEIAAERLLELDPADSGTHVLLSNIYAEASEWNGVRRLRKEQKERGKLKTPGCSSIQVDGIVHEFLVRDNSHPLLEELHSLLKILNKHISTNICFCDRLLAHTNCSLA